MLAFLLAASVFLLQPLRAFQLTICILVSYKKVTCSKDEELRLPAPHPMHCAKYN